MLRVLLLRECSLSRRAFSTDFLPEQGAPAMRIRSGAGGWWGWEREETVCIEDIEWEWWIGGVEEVGFRMGVVGSVVVAAGAIAECGSVCLLEVADGAVAWLLTELYHGAWACCGCVDEGVRGIRIYSRGAGPLQGFFKVDAGQGFCGRSHVPSAPPGPGYGNAQMQNKHTSDRAEQCSALANVHCVHKYKN